MNFKMFKQGLERAEEPKIKWIIEKAREFQKNIYFCFIDYAKAFECVYYNYIKKLSVIVKIWSSELHVAF